MGACRLRQRRPPARRSLLTLVVAVAVAAGLLAIVLATAAPAAASTTYWPLLRFGSAGTGNGQFGQSSPDAVAVDAAGNIYCTDPGNDRVEKFTSAGAFVCLIGATDHLSSPYGLTVAPDGTVYVMDSYHNRVRKYTPNARGTSYSVAGGWSIPAVSGDYAHGICTDTASPCQVFVADGPNNEVLEYSADGILLFIIGSGPGSGASQFNHPADVAATWSGGTGDLYVADADNSRVTKWHYNGTSWAYAATVASGDAVCRDPEGVDVDGAGNVYYSDFAGFRVHRYDLAAGGYTAAATYGTGVQVSRGNAGFWFPWGLAVSASGATICVGDTDCEVHVLSTDTKAPTTVAYPASVKHGKRVNLRYKVKDPAPSCGRATVTIKIFKAGKLKKKLALGSHVSNVLHGFRWKCTLAKGRYTIKVYATDAAGNRQSKVGSARLTVH